MNRLFPAGLHGKTLLIPHNAGRSFDIWGWRFRPPPQAQKDLTQPADPGATAAVVLPGPQAPFPAPRGIVLTRTAAANPFKLR